MVGRTDPLCPKHTPQSNMPTSAICLIVTLPCHLHSCDTGAAESLFLDARTQRAPQHREIDCVRHRLVTRGTGVKVVT